jgi:predicted RNA-binding protein with EMAP domain
MLRENTGKLLKRPFLEHRPENVEYAPENVQTSRLCSNFNRRTFLECLQRILNTVQRGHSSFMTPKKIREEKESESLLKKLENKL